MKYFLRKLQSLPLQLIASISTAICLSSVLSPEMICGFYTLSTVFVDVLMIALPLIVFVYIFSAIIEMDRRSPWIVATIFIAVTVSNACALIFAWGVGTWLLPSMPAPENASSALNLGSAIRPLLCIQSPISVGTDKALLAGIISGLPLSFLASDSAVKGSIRKTALKARDMITLFLQKLFIPFLPLYVFGFSLKLAFEGSFHGLVATHAQVFLLSMAVLVFYITMLYLLAASGKPGRALRFMRNMAPAGMTGFSTMSSAATLPVSLACARKNVGNKHFPELVIPATANIHMLGDDLTIVLAAFGMLVMAGKPLPGLVEFLPFAGAFCIAKLSCVGIPGASVLVILPVLQNYLGFSPEMISMLTTIYILQDPFGTSANVMGNGAFAVILYKISGKLSSRFPKAGNKT